MVFYAAFNIIWVISLQQLTQFVSFQGFTSTRLGQGYSHEKPIGSSLAQAQDPCITSKTLYHWAMQDPIFVNPFPNKPWF